MYDPSSFDFFGESGSWMGCGLLLAMVLALGLALEGPAVVSKVGLLALLVLAGSPIEATILDEEVMVESTMTGR
jgi:hypothetical protein